jgi:LPXTG-motif cell wall-anchored protein
LNGIDYANPALAAGLNIGANLLSSPWAYCGAMALNPPDGFNYLECVQAIQSQQVMQPQAQQPQTSNASIGWIAAGAIALMLFGGVMKKKRG